MADIVVSSKKKINLFDRVIQSVVIAVNMNKMNRAIDEHLGVIRKTEGEEQKVYQENILREIVFVKYQYDITNGLMKDADGNIRYSGLGDRNYVLFNCSLIGINQKL